MSEKHYSEETGFVTNRIHGLPQSIQVFIKLKCKVLLKITFKKLSMLFVCNNTAKHINTFFIGGFHDNFVLDWLQTGQ